MLPTIYCPSCEQMSRLSEDGYCLVCGIHYDNMRLKPSQQSTEAYIHSSEMSATDKLTVGLLYYEVSHYF